MERRHTISLMYTVYTPKWRLKPGQNNSLHICISCTSPKRPLADESKL